MSRARQAGLKGFHTQNTEIVTMRLVYTVVLILAYSMVLLSILGCGGNQPNQLAQMEAQVDTPSCQGVLFEVKFDDKRYDYLRISFDAPKDVTPVQAVNNSDIAWARLDQKEDGQNQLLYIYRIEDSEFSEFSKHRHSLVERSDQELLDLLPSTKLQRLLLSNPPKAIDSRRGEWIVEEHSNRYVLKLLHRSKFMAFVALFSEDFFNEHEVNALSMPPEFKLLPSNSTSTIRAINSTVVTEL